jgi:hypothetical protein
VVLGEGEPGILRLILEAQGFDVVGHARDDGELRTILDLTDPTVVVLDAGISALAAADTRTRAPRAPIVVVWPRDTYTPLAEERVEPATVILELGNAVRRAAEHHLLPPPEPDDVVILEPELDRPVVVPEAPARPRRRRRALVGAAAWTVALTAFATIAAALPSLLDDGATVHPAGGRRPLVTFTPDREGTTVRAARSDGGTCETRSRGRGRANTTTGRGNGRANGHAGAAANGRACDDHGRGNPGGNGNGHGRPTDPGKGSGRGQGSSRGDRPASGPPGSEQSGGANDDEGSNGSTGSDGSGSHASGDTDPDGDGGGGGASGPPEDGPSKGSAGDRGAGADHGGPGGGPADGGAKG